MTPLNTQAIRQFARQRASGATGVCEMSVNGLIRAGGEAALKGTCGARVFMSVVGVCGD